VNLEKLAELGEKTITPEVLKAARLVQGKNQIKVLGDGELKSALTIQAHKFSKSAQEKITKAGGKFEVLQ
jgi:large subunit ribosomal protein L15